MDGGRPSTRKFGKNSKKAPFNEGKGCAKGPSIRPITKKSRDSAKKFLQGSESEILVSPPEVRKLFLWDKNYGLVLVLTLSLHECRRFLKRKRDIFNFEHQGEHFIFFLLQQLLTQKFCLWLSELSQLYPLKFGGYTCP